MAGLERTSFGYQWLSEGTFGGAVLKQDAGQDRPSVWFSTFLLNIFIFEIKKAHTFILSCCATSGTYFVIIKNHKHMQINNINTVQGGYRLGCVISFPISSIYSAWKGNTWRYLYWTHRNRNTQKPISEHFHSSRISSH